jgi:hypothetical protein
MPARSPIIAAARLYSLNTQHDPWRATALTRLFLRSQLLIIVDGAAAEDKADGFLKTLVAWLRTNMLTSFEVVHQGVPKKLVEWLKGHRTGGAAVRDLLELTGSVCLATSFEDRYPEYPTFTVKLYASNLKQPTEDVLRCRRRSGSALLARWQPA